MLEETVFAAPPNASLPPLNFEEEDTEEEVVETPTEDRLDQLVRLLDNPQEMLDVIKASLQHSKDARKDREADWDEAWRLYNNDYDFTKKADWQSKNHVPALTMAVEFATALIKRAMLEANEYYTIETTRKDEEFAGKKMSDWALILKDVMDFWLERVGRNEEGFIEAFATALKSGLITGTMPIQVYWKAWAENSYEVVGEGQDRTVERVRKEKEALGIDFESPFDVYQDPTARGMYLIHRVRLDLYRARKYVEDGIFSEEAFKKLEDGAMPEAPEANTTTRTQQQQTSPPESRKSIIIWTYWGDLTDKQGKIIMENCRCIVGGNDVPDAVPEVLLQHPTENPFWHNKRPMIMGGIFQIPFSIHSRGLIQPALGLQRMLTELGNLILDANLFGSIKAFEVDVGMVADPQQLKTGVMPGKMYKRRGGMPGQKMIDEIKVGGVDAMSANIFSMFERLLQNSTGITEFLMGAPAARGRPTATEIVSGRAQATSLVEHIARTLERNVLEPILEMTYQVILQHMNDFEDPRVREILGEDVQAILDLSDADRLELLYGNFRFRARGMSVVLGKAQELLKIMQFMKLAADSPMMSQQVKWDAMLMKAVEAFSWDPREVLLSDEEQLKKQQEMMMQMMQAQAAGGGGAGAGGGGGAPPGFGEVESGATEQAMPEIQGEARGIDEGAPLPPG